MSKGYILVDVPENCSNCRCFSFDIAGCYCSLASDEEYSECFREIKSDWKTERPDWCPIRELPERRKETLIPVSERVFKRCSEYATGWNDCLKTIISNQEERDNAKDV